MGYIELYINDSHAISKNLQRFVRIKPALYTLSYIGC